MALVGIFRREVACEVHSERESIRVEDAATDLAEHQPEERS